MESARGIAELAVQSLWDGDFDLYGDYLMDLERLVQSDCKEVRRLLLQAEVHRAYLKQADHAAKNGDEVRTKMFLRKAIAYVGEAEVAALAEEHRYSFCVVQTPAPPQPERARSGFVR